jgi:hypothetical protein
MYGTGYGSLSGMIHLYARRPVLATVVVLAATVAVARIPTAPPPVPTPAPQAVVTFLAPAPAPAPDPAADSDRVVYYAPEASRSENYSCVFGKAPAPTNLCKATLDSIALYLINNPNATADVTGSLNHVIAVRNYFVAGESKFDIDPRRVHGKLKDHSGIEDDTVVVTQNP